MRVEDKCGRCRVPSLLQPLPGERGRRIGPVCRVGQVAASNTHPWLEAPNMITRCFELACAPRSLRGVVALVSCVAGLVGQAAATEAPVVKPDPGLWQVRGSFQLSDKTRRSASGLACNARAGE